MGDEDLRIVAATYNVHRCVGADRRGNVARIADVILSMDADVVALQEVETPREPASRCLLRQLRAHGYAAIPGPTLINERHFYGNVLLSRVPVRRVERTDISVPRREPRGAVAGELVLPGMRELAADADDRPVLYCLATHLGLRAAERRAQIAQITGCLDRARHRPDGCGVLLLGDFNEWLPGQLRLKPFDRRLQRAPPRPTFPSRFPFLALDRIWFSSRLRLESVEAIASEAARRASDHLPLRAVLRLAAAPGRRRARIAP